MLPEPTFAIEVRLATAEDLPFLDRLQKRYNKELGYFPRGQYAGYLEQDAILIAHEAGRPGAGVGFILYKDRYLKRDELGVVYQLCVDGEKQRGFVGAALLKAAFERSAYGCKLFCCWCAQDLPANRFWEAMGFVPLAFRAGSGRKGRVHILWQRRIDAGDQRTPLWYPFQTTGGAMRADRLAFPIPPGTHWSEVTAVAAPLVDADGQPVEAKALAGPRKRRVAVKKPVEPTRETLRIFVGGKFKLIPMPTNVGSGRSAMERVAPPAAEVPAVVPAEPSTALAPAAAPPQIDPRFLSASRELRDRYLEQLNAHPELTAAAGKYDAARSLPDAAWPTDYLPAMEAKLLAA